MPRDTEHRRKNIRLQGYDYARTGLYFLTVVVQNRVHLFGQVINGEMILNDAGRMVEKWYHEIENKYPDKRCREMVVMPNHIHCIIENMGTDNVSPNDAHVGDTDTDIYTDTHVTGTDTQNMNIPHRTDIPMTTNVPQSMTDTVCTTKNTGQRSAM
jgi:REP element-mobilizing transposase RayT